MDSVFIYQLITWFDRPVIPSCVLSLRIGRHPQMRMLNEGLFFGHWIHPFDRFCWSSVAIVGLPTMTIVMNGSIFCKIVLVTTK
jgi:hypothetical protein